MSRFTSFALALAAGLAMLPVPTAAEPQPASPPPGTPTAATGQAPAPAAPADTDTTADGNAPAAAAQEPPEDPGAQDMRLNPAQPEFTIVNLPTTLRLPKGRFAFRVSHRFTRDLTEGGFDDLLADFFGFDGGAQIGLELRYGLLRGWQVGVYRTSDRTIELFTQYNVLRQGERNPVTVDALVTFEGTNNLHDDDPNSETGEASQSPAVGAVVSHAFGRTASVNATIAWVNNTNPLPSDLVDHNDTVILGIGGRVRVLPTVYVVAEVVPRIGGNEPNDTLASFGIEKRVGGHAFQVNFSKGIGTTMAQIARGGLSDQWYIGFNINRKFF